MAAKKGGSSSSMKVTTEATGYQKKQYLQAERFTRIEKDVLDALMEDGQSYTFEQAETLLAQFMNKEAF